MQKTQPWNGIYHLNKKYIMAKNIALPSLFFILTLIGCHREDSSFSSMTKKMPGEWIIDLAIDMEDNVWFLTGEIDTAVGIEPWRCSLPVKFHLSRLENDRFHIVEISSVTFHRMIFDRLNNLWSISAYHVLMIDNNEPEVIVDISSSDEGSLGFIDVDAENTIWAGGLKTGLLKIKDGNVTRYLSDNSDLPTNSMTAIHIDQNNIIWIALWDKQGILKIDGDEWTHINSENSSISNQNIWDLTTTSDGDLWIGMGWDDVSVSLMYFDGISWKVENPKTHDGINVTGTVRYLLTDHNDKIYCAIEVGSNFRNEIYSYDGSGWSLINILPENDGVSDMEIDQQNRIWVSTHNSGYFMIQ